MNHFSLALVCLCLVSLGRVAECQTKTDFTFDEDLEGMTTHRGIWRWSDRASLNYQVAAGGEGFAIYEPPESTGDSGDELYSQFIPLTDGLSYTITYFISSEYQSSTTLALHKLSASGTFLEQIADYTYTSSPFNREWMTVSGYVDPEPFALFSVFCQSSRNNPVNVTGYLWGCAIDHMTVITGPEIGTTTVPTPTTTTEEPTTTTEEPTTTTEEPTTTTEEPTTTTEEPTTTTEEPTTTTEEPTTTTEEPTTTTEEPTTTTEEPTTTTTEEPTLIIDFNFENGTDGWVLGHSNGAAWTREISDFPTVSPVTGNYVLRVRPVDIYTGVVMAMSPRMVVGATGQIRLGVDFYMEGTVQYPSMLKIRRTTSYTTFDDVPALNLDGFGDQMNQNWLQHGAIFRDLTPGEEFNIVLEGSLGIDNLNNQIAVSRIQVEGADLVQEAESNFFDFETGLEGWTMGSVDGGRWLVYNYSEIDANFYIPPPTEGDNILIIDRFDIHAGVISIESPPITFNPNTVKELNLRFWMRGTDTYPSSLRLRRKTIDGVYDELPFLDLSAYGNINNLQWTSLDSYYQIPTTGLGDYFQLAIEADLGSDATNLVAIDSIRIITRVLLP